MNTELYTKPYEGFPKLSAHELRGTEGMKVSLIDTPRNPYYAIARGQSASWRPWQNNFTGEEYRDLLAGMANGTIWAGQSLECVNLTFTIENVSRALTHQLVRLRIGGGFMQESGREGRWDNAFFVTPLTILENESHHEEYVYAMDRQLRFYSRMVRDGTPPQDARMVVGHGIAQNIWMTVNFTALLNWCGKRLCTNMGWEINTLARMIRDAVLDHLPNLGVLLRSHCDRAGGHRTKDNTDFYKPGAANNGAKVYYEADREGDAILCGRAGCYSAQEIRALVAGENLR